MVIRGWLIAVFFIVVAAGAAVLFQHQNTADTTPTISQEDSSPPPVKKSTPPIVEEQAFDAVLLQQAVDEWQADIAGTAGVVITTASGEVLVASQADEVFFAASIYKLYVAYAGYLQVDRGEVDPAELYSGNRTRAECLDVMIRESDSPCAEKLWAELGKAELTQQLKDYGLTGTDMVSITTTAADAARMLARIESGKELSAASKAAFLESMRTQIYTDTFNQSFSEQVVYNKIGFRGYDEYHDVAIVEFSDGRKLIISTLTDGVGTSAIRALGTAVLAAVEQN